MKSRVLKATIAGLLGSMALVSTQASAHVGYGTDLSLGIPGTGGNNPTVTSNGGYIEGLQSGFLANSHDNKFRFFTLTTTSMVNFTIAGTSNTNGASVLNPGFSLFNGLVPAASHDGVGDVALNADGSFNAAGYATLSSATVALLASETGFASWSPFAAVNIVIDHAKGLAEGTTALSAAATNWGSYSADSNFSMGNNSFVTNTLTYTGISGADASSTSGIKGADGLVDNKVSWSGTLAAGTYSLVIGGANQAAYDKLYSDAVASNSGLLAVIKATNLSTSTGVVATDTANAATNAANLAFNIAHFGASYATDTAAQTLSLDNLAKNTAYNTDRLAGNSTITFNVSAVPVPGAVWLFLSGMMGVLGFNRRKKGAMGGPIAA